MDSDSRNARNAVRVWMRQVMDQKGWSAADWARLAGTTPTNITRILSPTSEIIPSGVTIAKLAAVAGSQPNLGTLTRVGLSKLKVYILGCSLMETAETIDSPGPVPEKSFAVRLEADHPFIGLLRGDMLIVDPAEERLPVPGSIIIGRWKDKSICGRTSSSFVVWSNTDDPAPIDEVRIIGIAMQVVRSL